MKSWQKFIASSASVVLASTLLVTYGSEQVKAESSSSKTIKLWVPTGAKSSYKKTVKKFEKDSGYKVKIVESEDPKAQEKLKRCFNCC